MILKEHGRSLILPSIMYQSILRLLSLDIMMQKLRMKFSWLIFSTIIFLKLVLTFARHIPSTYRSFHHYLGERNESSIFFSPTYPQEIIKIISGLKINKSAGFDKVVNNV